MKIKFNLLVVVLYSLQFPSLLYCQIENKKQIGTQMWMMENLNTDTFQNGDLIMEAKTWFEWNFANIHCQPAYCYFNNDVKNGLKYGKLYNWYAVNDSRGLAPVGWHIPSYNEWNVLFEEIGGVSELNKPEWGFLRLANGFREANRQRQQWVSSLEEGFFTGGGYSIKSPSGFVFCSAQETIVFLDSLINVDYPEKIYGGSGGWRGDGVYVRCIQGEDLKSLNDEVLLNESDLIDELWQTKSKINSIVENDTLPIGFLFNNGDEVEIGEQRWMTKNLNVDCFRNGDIIPVVKTYKDWQLAGLKHQPACCFLFNDTNYGEKYGKLYNWYAVNDVRGLAPIGWHIPSKNEIDDLFSVMKSTFGRFATWPIDFRFELMSESGWYFNAPRFMPRSNRTRFSALPAGFRDNRGAFTRAGFLTFFWLATEGDIQLGNYWGFNNVLDWIGYFGSPVNNYELFHKNNDSIKGYGMSIRCIRD
jgi:uncharacterized protein (TIGR02145 family)